MRYVFPMMIMASIFSGCVVGQQIKMDYHPPQPQSVLKNQAKVNIKVADERPYIKDGTKHEDYIGAFRGGFGNKWNVTTFNNQPLKDQISRDLNEELDTLGFLKSDPNVPQQGLLVTIHDWNFDTYLNGKFTYDLTVEVKDKNGNNIASDQLKDERVIKGSVMWGPRGAFMKNIPIIYDEIIAGLVRNNQKILNALSKHE